MTNGDRIRTFSDEQLAFVLMCPVEAGLTFDNEEITIKFYSGVCDKETLNNCTQCVLDWLKQDEYEFERELENEGDFI